MGSLIWVRVSTFPRKPYYLTRTAVDHPLATGISILKGTAEVVVPKVNPGKNYQILGRYSLLVVIVTSTD